MEAAPALPPDRPDPALLRPGQARRCLGRIGQRAPGGLPRLPPSRVAELSSDSFLGRLRDAKARPDSPARSSPPLDGLSMLDGGAAAAAPPPASTLPPDLADHPDYEILRELGQGGMGVVYLAQNTLMGRMEVLKVVSGHLVNRRGVLDRFLGEIRIGRQAAPPQHRRRLHGPPRSARAWCWPWSTSRGSTCRRLVKATGPLPVANACNYVHQAALGLQHAHEHGMVHRDIKPANLILAREGNRGRSSRCSTSAWPRSAARASGDGGLTARGPDAGHARLHRPRADPRRASRPTSAPTSTAWAARFYYLLTGGPPFQGRASCDLYQAHFSMEAGPLNLVRPEVPVELAAMVAKMMAKEPDGGSRSRRRSPRRSSRSSSRGMWLRWDRSRTSLSQAGRVPRG